MFTIFTKAMTTLILASALLFAVSCAQQREAESARTNDKPTTGAKTNPDAGNTVSNESLPKSVVINIEDYAFGPDEITVAVGTKVTWVNKDKIPHTATADDKSFNSGMLDQGKEFSYVFSTPGTFGYYCIPHPKMKARVVVR